MRKNQRRNIVLIVLGLSITAFVLAYLLFDVEMRVRDVEIHTEKRSEILKFLILMWAKKVYRTKKNFS